MYQQPNLIQTQQAKNAFLPKLQQYRAVGPIEDYKYDALKPKKQMKEIRKVLLPEKKKILFLKYGHKFNFKDRCVVCGTHQIWESSDYLRPPIPLDKVEKGRPLKKGNIVMSGSTLATKFASRDDHAIYSIDGVGSVEVWVK